ncbi:MAG: hypothetical protein ABIK28_06995, partial [Planctomycetota bacterium]
MQDIILNMYRALTIFRLLIGYSRIFICALFSSKAKLATRLLASESQLAVYKYQINQKKEPMIQSRFQIPVF